MLIALAGFMRTDPTIAVVLIVFGSLAVVARQWRVSPAPEKRAKAAPTGNPYESALLIGGVLAVIIGAVVGFAGNNAAETDRFGNALAVSIGGLMMNDPSAGDTGTAWMWFGIVLAILGVISMLSVLIIRAARGGRS